jgi:hypothetical protein
MPSPNLAVTHVAAAQNQKEVTINDAIDALDNAMNQALSLAMADANLTLTGTQANRKRPHHPHRYADCLADPDAARQSPAARNPKRHQWRPGRPRQICRLRRGGRHRP